MTTAAAGAAPGQASADAGGAQTPEQKAAADAATAAAATAAGKAGGADGTGKPDAATAAAAPVTYTLTVPDDAKDLVGADDLTYWTEVAKASNWSNEDAQREMEAAIDRTRARLTARSDGWANETKSDPEIGGANLAVSERQITAVLDRFWPESEPHGKAFRQGITAEGHRSWLPFAKGLARIGKAMSEDSPGQLGTAGAGARKSDAEVIFGDVVAAQKG